MYFISYKCVVGEVGSNCQLAFLVTNFMVFCTSVYFINCLTALLEYIFLTTLVLQLLAELPLL